MKPEQLNPTPEQAEQIKLQLVQSIEEQFHQDQVENLLAVCLLMIAKNRRVIRDNESEDGEKILDKVLSYSEFNKFSVHDFTTAYSQIVETIKEEV